MVISVNKLKIGANFLQKKFDSLKIKFSDSLESKVLLRYSQRTLNKLTAILNTPQTHDQLLTQLELFLQNNWRLVKGTSLSYTALPNHEITEILCGVANYIVQERNKGKSKTDEPCGSVKLLMPTVSTESISNDYPSLEPTFDVSQGVWVDVELTRVLQTHILSSDGLSLFPVLLFAKLDTDIDSQRIANPYFDYNIHSKNAAYLNDDEYERLIGHSLHTKAIVDAKKYYETFLADKNNLLGHLRQLCMDLIFNSAQGVGKETQAGNGVDAAITQFNAYYETIGNEKDKIPSVLKQKLEELPKFLVDYEFFLEKIRTGETCVVGIRRDLVSAILGHESKLSAIAVQGVNKTELLEKAQVKFNVSKQALIDALNQESYTSGADKLGLTLSLVTNLGINFSISSESDLKTVQQLSPATITDFFRDPKLQQQLVRQLPSGENWVSFFMGMSPDRLKAILPFVSLELSQSMLQSPHDLLAIFSGLDTVRCQLVCNVLKPSFRRIMPYIDGVTRVLRYLEPERRYLVSQTYLEVWGNESPQLVKSAEDFKDLLQYLSPEQGEVIFAAVKHKIARLIKSTSDFKAFMEYLSPLQRSVVYKLMKSSLPGMVKGSWDVSNCLQYFDADQRAEAFNDFLKAWIVRQFSLSDAHYFLSEVFKYCDAVQCKTICELLRGEFTSIEHFLGVFDSLGPDKKIIFYGSLRAEVPKLIKSAADLRSIFPHLTPEECKFVLQSCQANHDDFSSWNFSCLLASIEHYSVAHCDVVYEVLKDYLPQSGKQVYYLLSNFSKKHSDSLYVLLKTKLPWIIKSGVDFKYTLEYLNEGQRDYIYELLKEHLPQIIHSAADLQAVLAYLTQAQRTEVCTAIKSLLPKLLLSTQSLVNLLWILPLGGRKVVYEAIVGETVSHEITDEFLLSIEEARLDIKPSTHLLDNLLGAQAYADKQRKLHAPKMKFELALANANPQEVNTKFNALMRLAGTHRNNFFTGGNTRSCTELIESMAKIKNKQHLGILCNALQLRLSHQELQSPRAIEKALFHYVKSGHDFLQLETSNKMLMV